MIGVNPLLPFSPNPGNKLAKNRKPHRKERVSVSVKKKQRGVYRSAPLLKLR